MNDRLTFVSIVGTQAFGTLEPLLVLYEKYGAMQIRLLHTAKTLETARRLLEYIAENGLGEAKLLRVSQSLDGEDAVPQILARLAQEANESGRRLCFNLDGGMNYLIAVAAMELDKHDALCIQCSKDRAVLTDLRDGSHHALRLKKALPPAEILKYQGAPYEANLKTNPDKAFYPLARLLKDAGVTPPANAMQNVAIDNLVFDYVWNPGNNRLCFLKDWRFESAEGELVARDRDFAQWAKDRTRGGHLYDREIYALVQNKSSRERLEADSGGKIKTVLFARPKKGLPRVSSDEADSLRKIFGAKPPKVTEKRLDIPPAPDLPPLKNDTLVVCVGTDILTTILAIRAHKPKHVLLAWSRDNPLVKEYAERIHKYARELGVDSVASADFKLEGIYADHVLPVAEKGARVVVNISPGTKGQGAMLARWAARNGHEVWSLHNASAACSPLKAPPETPPFPLEICDPALLFRLMGREILEDGASETDLAPDFDWLDALLAFMRRLDANGLDMVTALEKGYLANGGDVLKKTGSDRWLLRLKGRQYSFHLEGRGAWFEKLCARALLNAGAAHVRLNLKLNWDEENLQKFARIYGEGNVTHQREFDVIGSFKGKLVLLSAKSYPLREKEAPKDCVTLEKAVQDARDAAHVLDKFTLSLVTHLGSTKKSPDDRVAVLTWRDICHPNTLATQIMELARGRSTTIREVK